MLDEPIINLNISDIADAVKVIDHAADHAAFRGWVNIRQVLALRDRLDGFVTAASAESEPPMVNLNISDIADAVKVIDHAADQAAFRGWTNIRQVLALRDRLEVFVVAAAESETTSSSATTQ